MEQRSCAGYVITQSIKVKDTEFVLGEHPKTGMCVTWQCKNSDNYFWAHYCENYYAALKDLCERQLRKWIIWHPLVPYSLWHPENQESLRGNAMGYGLDASTAKFELVTVLNLPMLFTCCRVDQDTVPEDLYIYEVSHDENVRGKPVQISEWIRVNLWGTLLTSKPIRLDKHPRTLKTYREINSEVDWNYEGRTLTVNQYMDRYPPIKGKQKCHDR